MKLSSNIGARRGGYVTVLFAVLLLAIATAACGAANALDYKADPGPHTVSVETGTWVDQRRGGREVPWKLYRPETITTAVPVVVWSHGLGGSRDGGEYLGRHLASHGYAAFHIQHAGSDAALLARGRDALFQAVNDPEVSVQRFLDVPFAVTQIRAMAGEGTHAGQFDVTRMGMSGHSYGALSTLAAAGQRFGPQRMAIAEPAFKGAFAMSPTPPRTGVVDGVYTDMLMPIFHLTGTADDSPLGDGLKPIDRRIPYDTIAAVDQYLLILDKGVHMTFSGRRRPGYPGLERHHALIRMAAVAFWDTVLNDDPAARAWLEEGGFTAALGTAGTFEFKRAVRLPAAR